MNAGANSSLNSIRHELEAAWKLRDALFSHTEALRVFHGPGDSLGVLSQIAIEKFQDHYWVIEWEKGDGPQKALGDAVKKELIEFLKSKAARSAVILERPERGVPAEAKALFGTPPEKIAVSEGRCKVWIRFLNTRHPGLFMDHSPLRLWLLENARDWKVLNTFAYTGSLSVAAGLGGASHVTTLDLSKPTLNWAQENWELNGLKLDQSRFIHGDYFEWLPRLKREKQLFDCVILDPPSSSTSKNGRFSTAKDLVKLHEAALDVLAPEGVLITSINSANVTLSKFESDVGLAARSRKRSFEVLREIQQPGTFPTKLGDPKSRYLKGWVLKALE